jgi:hypothetical protein
MRVWHCNSRTHADRTAPGWPAVVLGCGFALLMVTPLFAKEGMDRKTRIDIIRGLLREVAVTKIPMPRVNAQGKLDVEQAQNELHFNGAAMQAGMPAQITRIEFKSTEMVFELNGGGKSGKKWYQRIQIDMGGTISPVDQNRTSATAVFGSSITLDYGEPLPDLTIPQIKKILSGVLDFERHSPTVLYSPNVSPEVKKAIKSHKVIVGMDRDAVLAAKGTPDRKVREERNGAEEEDWIYGLPPHVLYVVFDEDKVTSVKQY